MYLVNHVVMEFHKFVCFEIDNSCHYFKHSIRFKKIFLYIILSSLLYTEFFIEKEISYIRILVHT